MNWKTTIALVVLAGAAGAWFFKGDAWAPKVGLGPTHPEPPPSAAVAAADAMTPAEITRVEVAFPSGDPLVIERAATEAGWKVAGNWPLRKAEVAELVETLGSLRTRFHAVPVGDNPAKFGLAPEQKPLRVTVTAGGKPHTLLFGELKPGGDETKFTNPAFVRIDDAPEVLRLGPDVMRVVRRPAESYRRRSLFPDVERVKVAPVPPPFDTGAPPDPPAAVTLPGEDTETVTVSRPAARPFGLTVAPLDGTFTLRRRGKLAEPASLSKGGEPALTADRVAEAWQLDAPYSDRVEPNRLRGVLAAVADLWVDQFVPTADAKFALDSRFALAQLMPIPFEPAVAFAVRQYRDEEKGAYLDPLRPFVPVEERTGLAGAGETVTVKRVGAEPVTVRFGGLAKITERDETTRVPVGPMGQTIPQTRKVPTRYRYARVDGGTQVFVVSAEKLPDLFAFVGPLVDPQVARFSADDVQEVVIAPPGRPEVKLTRKKGDPKAKKDAEKVDRWFIDATPNPILADSGRVSDLLGRLAAFRADGYDRAAYPPNTRDPDHGLAGNDATRVRLKVREKRPESEPLAPEETIALMIGRSAAGRLPVRAEGWPRVTLADDKLGPDEPDSWLGSILFPPNTVSKLIARPAIAYRDRRLFDAASTLETVLVANGFGLKKTGDEWKLTAPITSDADPAAALKLTASLAGLEATEYLTATPTADDLKAFALDPPARVVALTFSGGRTYTLELGGPRPGKPEVFARLDGGGVFGLPASAADQFTTGAVGLLPLKVWAAAPDKVVSLDVARTDAPGESYALARDGANWKLTGPFTAPIPDRRAKELFTPLAALTAVRNQAIAAPNPGEFGLDKPFLSVKFTALEKKPGTEEEAPTTRQLLVGVPTPDGAGRYATLGGPVFVVPAAFVAAAQTPPLELLDKSLLTLNRDQIVKVRVAPAKAEDAFTLAKDAAGKWAAEGTTFAVDALRIGDLLAAAAAPPVVRIAAYGDAVKWADYGLDQPEATVTITLAAGETHTVAVGKPDPSGFGRFARVDGGKAVAVVTTVGADNLARKRFEYADRSLLAFDPLLLGGFARRTGKDELELTPNPAGTGWDIGKPAKQKGDGEFLTVSIAEPLGKLRAERVAAYGKKDEVFKQYGLEPAAAVITLTFEDNKPEPKTLRLGNPVDPKKPDGERYAAVESAAPEVIVGVVSADLANKLLAPPVAFRDRTLARFVDADKAVLERGDRKVTFAKVGGTWRLTEPLAAPAESGDLEALVGEFGKLRADTWVAEKGKDLAAFGLDKPEARWVLSDGDKVVLTLLVGKKAADGRAHVVTDKGELVGLLDGPKTNLVLAEYRQRKPWDLDAAQVEAVEVARGGAKFSLEKAGMAWLDPDKPGDLIDSRVVNELLGTLGALKVERYSVDKDADLKLYGLEKPELVLTASLRDGRRVLEVGGTVGGTDGKQRYARVADKDGTAVFVLTAADTLRLTRDRAAYVLKK